MSENPFLRQKSEMASLNLINGQNSGSLSAFYEYSSRSRRAEIDAARQKYLDEHGEEAIKARWPKAWHLAWPRLGITTPM